MSQNGQTDFKNAARFLSFSDHFGALCIKGLSLTVENKMRNLYKMRMVT